MFGKFFIILLLISSLSGVQARTLSLETDEPVSFQPISLELKSDEERAKQMLSTASDLGKVDLDQLHNDKPTSSQRNWYNLFSWLPGSHLFEKSYQGIKTYCTAMLTGTQELLTSQANSLMRFFRVTVVAGAQEGYTFSKQKVSQVREKSEALYTSFTETHSLPQRTLKRSSYYLAATLLNSYVTPLIAVEIKRNYGPFTELAFLAGSRAVESTLFNRLFLGGLEDTKKFAREMITGKPEIETLERREFTYYSWISPVTLLMSAVEALARAQDPMIKFCVRQGIYSTHCMEGVNLAQEVSVVFSNTFGVGLSDAARTIKTYAAACDATMTFMGYQSLKQESK